MHTILKATVCFLFAVLAFAGQPLAQGINAGLLQTVVSVAAGCPVTSITIGSPTDQATWSATYNPVCTAPQIAAGNTALSNYSLINFNKGQAALVTYNAAITAGLTINSTGTPSMNGTYAIDITTLTAVQQISVYISLASAFPQGRSTLFWTTSGNQLPNITAYQAAVKATLNYKLGLDIALGTAQAGGSPVWPSASVTIP